MKTTFPKTTAKAIEIELRLGVKNPQEFFADKGQDWRTQIRQMAEFIQYVQALEKEYKLQPGQAKGVHAV